MIITHRDVVIAFNNVIDCKGQYFIALFYFSIFLLIFL